MYAWLNTQIGADAASVVSYIAMCITLFAVAWLCLALFRRLNRKAFHMIGRKRKVRLSVRDAATIDNRRRVVLIRRDNVEHLILVGGPSDMVIERNINVINAPEVKPHAQLIRLPSAEEKPAAKAKPAIQTEETGETLARSVLVKEEKKPEKELHAAASEPATTAIQPANTPAVPQPAAAIQSAPVIPQTSPAPATHTASAAAPAANAEAGQPIQHTSPRNGIPPLKANRRPPTPQVQLHQHTSPYFAGNRQTMSKTPVNQPAANQPSLNQQQASSASASRQQHAAINLQTPPARNMRQNGVPPRPITTAPRTNGTNGHVSSNPGHPNQQTNAVAAAISPNNATGDNAHIQNGDLASLVTGNAVNRPMNAHRELATDMPRVRKEAGRHTASRSNEEDFEKILQEELIRVQANLKLSSSNEN